METFQVRLNCIDHYQAAPSEFDPPLPLSNGSLQQKDRPKVPVIRVFGATETGQRVCAHIHGALPYLYIEYKGSLVPDEVESAIRSLHLAIDQALAISYRRDIYDGKTAFVAHITLVKGVPFYGFNVGYKFFFKVYMLNPSNMTRFADILRQGAVLKRVLQPYESHLQYLTQWMCDYNMYGCDYIKCSKVKFRGPVPDSLEVDKSVHHWHDESISPELISDETSLSKQSHCPLEVDISVEHILNRLDIKQRPLHHDFIERTNPTSPDVKMVHSMAGLWKAETERRKKQLGLSDSRSTPFSLKELVSMSADPRNTENGDWIHEEEYRSHMKELAKDEQRKSDGMKPSFNTFVKKTPFESFVKTALESVEDLYFENLQALGLEKATSQTAEGEADRADAQVDKNRILSLELEGSSGDSRSGSGGQTPQTQDELEASGKSGEEQLNDSFFDGVLNMPELDDHHHVAPEDGGLASSSEREKFGVRKADRPIDIEEDEFEIPDEFVSEMLPLSKPRKRRRAFITDDGPSKKRVIVSETGNIPQLQNTGDSDVPDSGFYEPQSSVRPNDFKSTSDAEPKAGVQSIPRDHPQSIRPSQHMSKSVGSQKNKKIPFPIVKDPNDPSTILRLSQQSSSQSKTSSQLTPEKPPGSPPVCSDQSTASSDGFSDLSASSATTTQFTPYINDLCRNIRDSFRRPRGRRLFCLQTPAPSAYEVRSTMNDDFRPSVIYQNAYYSNENDVPERPREYAGREFKLESDTVPFLPDFDPTGMSPAMYGEKTPVVLDRIAQEDDDEIRRRKCTLRVWEISQTPPRYDEVVAWLQQEAQPNEESSTKESTPVQANKPPVLSQIDGPTQKNSHGFKFSQNKKAASAKHGNQYMSVMSLEIHVNTRGKLSPNPEEDEISCVFWCVKSDDQDFEINCGEHFYVGVLALSEDPGTARKISRGVSVEVEEEPTEIDLITRVVDIVRQYDPDIITGYEVHNSSWGYLIERARFKFDYNLCDELSRVKFQSHGRYGKDSDRWGFDHTSTIRVTGRHMINIWRAMRGELNLLQYTMENVTFHLLHRRIPHYPFQDLTAWYKSGKPRDLAKVIDYFISRVRIDVEILETNELVERTSEQARLLGIDFFSVFSRGSQFKVESLMFRIAKPENFILVSPSKKQVGQQNALECLPLVMEPRSDFYTSPLLVLDFQSLYPSVMIAYNYCYSTFLGRVVNWRGQNKMGFTDFKRPPRLLELLDGQVNVAPNGIMYVKPEIRKSLLAKMLSEILETRVMVKSGMKTDKEDRNLQRLLNNRQLALKLIANVTYGYTSASFSGRMPCAEIADSIVQTGRETLEKAIALIHSVERWGAEVVYGDTDSLFISLKGRSKEEAFDLGEEISKAVTDANPRPIKLKFEKVYHPCILLAKKRYVGFKYESRSQKEPDFDAKGIETIRRDGTPAEQKIEEKALKILFRTSDLSRVKSYFQSQCQKIMQGHVSIQDFCFAKEVRLGTYSENGRPPPGAMISMKKMADDPRQEAQYGERVPYVVIAGAPGSRLIDRCVAPEVLLRDAQLELDAEYYISKNLIPPLERIFNLVGANVRQWYDEMPRYQRIRRIEGTSSSLAGPMKRTLESYMKSSLCIVCNEKIDIPATSGAEQSPICERCLVQQPHISLLDLRTRLVKAEKKNVDLQKICRSCMDVAWGEEVRCDSKDCPVFYSRTRHLANLRSEKSSIEPVVKILEDQEAGLLDW
ncbi:DNA polymerase zeta [Arachnomyces sp. PD_36]|nr:DNA polymerase zeta [Arachnomyces sp. PD_36]